MKTRNLFIIFGLFLIACFSCKKDNPTPAASCNILTAMTSGTDSFTYEYDSQDRLVKEMRNGTLNASIVYNDGGNTIVETSTSSITTYTLNSSKQLVSQVRSANDGSVYKDYYTYDANNFVTKLISQTYEDPNATPDIDTLLLTNTIANGNMVESVLKDPSGKQVGLVRASNDLTRPNNIPNARPYLANTDIVLPTSDKNLLLNVQYSEGNSYTTVAYTYEFDSKGRISKQTGALKTNQQSGVIVSTYTYRCN